MTFLTKSLPRRTVLRGMGVAMALPFLDAMLPTLRAATKPSNRFLAFYVPNGMAMEYWTPKGEGTNYELSPILEPLAPFRDQMLVFSGIKSSWNYIHAGASGSFLTGTKTGGKNEIEIIADVSIDQLLGRHFASETQVGSLEMSMDVPANAGACTGNLSCAYTHTLSWRSRTQPLPPDWNPRAVFERLFGDSGSTDPAARQARMNQTKSILDSVNGKLASLKKELGPTDQSRVNEYTDAVRDVERRIQRAEEQRDVELPTIAQPQGAPPVFEDHLALMLDLQLLAFQSDLTRVITFMIAKEQSARPYPQIGVPEAHHPLSHHDNVPELIAKMSKINTYHTQLLAGYLAKLRATPDGDGNLLDHMTILYGSGISNSTGHSGDNLPLLLLGGGGGKLKGGRHIRFPEKPSNANLLVTIMDKMGVPVDHVGGSNGKLTIDPLPGYNAMYQLMTIALAIFLMGAAENRPPLVDAAKAGDKDAMVRLLAQKGVNVNATEGDGTTALHWASYHDDLESVNQLIRAGANVNAANDLGATPLWAASQNGSETMVRRLLESGANPNLALMAGETPVMVASRAGSPAVVELLLAKGANVNARGSRGQTALMWAVAEKHPEVVKVLIAHGANLHAKSDVWSQVMAVEPHGYLPYNKEIPAGGETALMFAARVGDLASAKLLVAAGANVNDTDTWGVSATTLAAHSDFRDVAEFLLDKGADPNAAAAGFNALHNAIMQRDEMLVASLLAHGADPNALLRTWTPNRRSANDYSFGPELVGATPFWLAARFTEPGIMKLLLQYKADPLVVHKVEHTVQDRAKGYVGKTEETTALMAAVGLGGGDAWIPVPANEREFLTLDAVKMTVQLGVNVNAKNTDGRTALDGAKTLRFDSVTKFLTDNGAKAGTGGGRGAAPSP